MQAQLAGSVPLPAPKPVPQLMPTKPSRWRQLLDLAWAVGLLAAWRRLASALWAAATLGQGLLVPAQLWLAKTMVDALAAQLQGRGGQDAPLWLGLLVAALLADRVLVLENGRIVEQGHHDALVAQGGVYAALFAAQAQWYR